MSKISGIKHYSQIDMAVSPSADGHVVRLEDLKKAEARIAPHIDPENLNWVVGGVDTGVSAQGRDGEQGVDSNTGQLLRYMPDTENHIVISTSGVFATLQSDLQNFTIPQSGFIAISLHRGGTWLNVRRNGVTVFYLGGDSWDGGSAIFEVTPNSVITVSGLGNHVVNASSSPILDSIASAVFFPIDFQDMDFGDMEFIRGNDGQDGENGADGNNGLSAFDLAVQEGSVGTLAEWLKSLRGEQGVDSNTGQLAATSPSMDGHIIITTSGVATTIASALQNFVIPSNGYIGICVDSLTTATRWLRVSVNGITRMYIHGGGWDGQCQLFEVFEGDTITAAGAGAFTVNNLNVTMIAGVLDPVVFFPMRYTVISNEAN